MQSTYNKSVGVKKARKFGADLFDDDLFHFKFANYSTTFGNELTFASDDILGVGNLTCHFGIEHLARHFDIIAFYSHVFAIIAATFFAIG